MSVRAVLTIAFAALLAAGCGRDPSPGAAAVATNNRAVGLMGMYRYAEAVELFDQLVRDHPGWVDARVNLAIATLNRQEDEDEARALEILREALADEPEHLRARYCTGLLLLRSGDAGAVDHLRFVVERDPDDAYATYFYASALEREDKRDEALALYRRAVEIEPYLRSAYYRVSQLLLRAGRREEGMAVNEDFQRLESNPRARTVDFIYTEMGPKGEAVAVDAAQPAPAPRPSGPLFAEARPLQPAGANATAADIDGDGDSDLFLARTGVRSGANMVVLQQDDGSFSRKPAHPLNYVEEVNTALWGDYDNDGRTDVYLCRRGGNQLWRRGEEDFEDVTDASGTAGGDLDTVDGAIVDADHDGDLDIFCVNADGPNTLLVNNRNGTFRALDVLAGDGRPSRQVIASDLDADRDLDIVVINEEPPHEVYFNDRLWAWRPAEGFDEFVDTPLASAVAADADADGRPELYALARDGVIKVWSEGPGSPRGWSARELHRLDASAPALRALAVVDVSGDGVPEVLAATTAGVAVIAARSGELLERAPAPDPLPLAAFTAVVIGNEGPALVGHTTDGPSILWAPGPGRFEFASLGFSGADDPGQSMRSNASGIGTRVAARAGSRWTVTTTLRQGAGPGQSLQPLAVGLGGAAHLDFVAIDWSDGVFQSEVHGARPNDAAPPRDLSGGRLETIHEIQRQLSSCPVLFAFDGERFVFVSDLLGVGGMGYLVAPGEYAPPRPWENFLIPVGVLQPRDGRFELKLTEPMEEACYLDQARLVAYDLPPGWRMALDERMAILGPEPTGRPLFYRSEVLPASAVNDRGERVIDEILSADHVAAPVGPLDHRFLGRLAGEHVLTLSFDRPIDGHAGTPVLLAEGWVEYPYSQTMFAAAQASADYRAPTLEARVDDGPWQVVSEQFGYPAGMPRLMAMPLADLPRGTTALRIRTNQEIYWDRLSIVHAEPCPEAKRSELALVEATLGRCGFPRRTTGAQRLPHYDYGDRTPFWDTRHQAGLYTSFGPVAELVSSHDDAMAIFGPGEEVHLAFAAPADAPAEGWTRRVVLETRGWCKDMDLFTAQGETVGPLPRSTPSPDRALHERYNTRYESGR